MKWITIGAVLLILVLGVLLVRSGGRFISYEFDNFPEGKLKGLIGSVATEGEMELSGALAVTTNARWYWLSKRFFPGTLLVNAKINGRKVHLVLDTGSNITVLDPKVAVEAKVGLTDKKGESFGTSFGKGLIIPIYLGQVQELEIDGLLVCNLPVTVWAMRPTVKLLGIPIYHDDGFLGMNLLKHLALRLDLQSGTITFSREPFLIEAKVPSVPLRVTEEVQEGLAPPLPFVEGFIGDSGPFPFLIDTGASGPALVGEEIWRALGLEGEKVTLERVQLGEIELQNVPAVRDETEHRRGIILLGSNIFLANGYKRLTLDFLAGRLYAER